MGCWKPCPHGRLQLLPPAPGPGDPGVDQRPQRPSAPLRVLQAKACEGCTEDRAFAFPRGRQLQSVTLEDA